ncbi:hypothetical protein [Bordetella trematum]|uniref:hypothetical protein n=1 Tax=Bordetella trematum TaxID=123899 RepID=UPI0015C57605|nr:hypothetical protein [Bordetella trematum]
MPEVIDGFVVQRSWVEQGEGRFYPAIDAELLLENGETLRGFRHVHSEGVFTTKDAAEKVARSIKVLGIVHNWRTVIIKIDGF